MEMHKQTIAKIGKSVKMFRHSKGMSRTVLAKKTGISTRTLARIEKGETTLKVLDLLLIAEAVHVSPIEILVEANIDWCYLDD